MVQGFARTNHPRGEILGEEIKKEKGLKGKMMERESEGKEKECKRKRVERKMMNRKKDGKENGEIKKGC